MQQWIEKCDGGYPDGFPRFKYVHESCEKSGGTVATAYPFCPYCGKRITHIKLTDNSWAYLYEDAGFIVCDKKGE